MTRGPGAGASAGAAPPAAGSLAAASTPAGRVAEVLRDAGAIAIPGALEAARCAHLIAEMRTMAAVETRPISPETMRREHDPEFVQSQTLVPTPCAHAAVTSVICERLSTLEGFFDEPLELNSELHFLIYGPGGFIRPHCDVLDGEHVLEKIRERLVVFTIFLNDDFEGGELALLPGFPRPPLVVDASPGTMVAFPSDLAHAVRTVTAGRRHSITGWFRAPGPDKQPRRKQ